MRGNSSEKDTDVYTSTGLTRIAAKALTEMSNNLHMNKREMASVAILAFQKSPQYTEITKEINEIMVLKDKYPGLFRKGGLLK